jgi:hypothetical protein
VGVPIHTNILWNPQALESYSEKRGAEAVALVEISWGCDRPGPLGMVRFIGPIILDKIFSQVQDVF